MWATAKSNPLRLQQQLDKAKNHALLALHKEMQKADLSPQCSKYLELKGAFATRPLLVDSEKNRDEAHEKLVCFLINMHTCVLTTEKWNSIPSDLIEAKAYFFVDKELSQKVDSPAPSHLAVTIVTRGVGGVGT